MKARQKAPPKVKAQRKDLGVPGKLVEKMHRKCRSCGRYTLVELRSDPVTKVPRPTTCRWCGKEHGSLDLGLDLPYGASPDWSVEPPKPMTSADHD